MLEPAEVYGALDRRGAAFFTGVPDSLLKELCAYISATVEPRRHVIAANEGAAVALAAGHHLATGEVGVVYLQNSGLGNAINPLLSLADREVYSIPMVLVIGWRGEPSVRDEPQHVKQGRVTAAMLEAMEIPHRILSPDMPEAEADVAWAVELARTAGQPVALLVRKGTFAPFDGPASAGEQLTREAAIELIAGALDPADAVVATTGMTSRELHEIRVRRGEPSRDFLTVGSMGHASAIACAIARARPERQVFCLDGDGAFLMHMGSVAVQGQIGSANFKHVLLNNGRHDSVGGQPTVARDCDLTAVARACGYATLEPVAAHAEVAAAVARLRETAGPALLEIRIGGGARADLGRPSGTPRENKEAFTAFLSQDAT
ncbi:MAG TPA: phosphonopyruvate decarboxylase [Thermoanaerobaculia bacterium]|jgi:phosphonopyruvate decarboxylase